MDNIKLIELRELLKSKSGELFLSYAKDFMVEMSSKSNANAEWIKGMGMLINHFNGVEEECRKQNERK